MKPPNDWRLDFNGAILREADQRAPIWKKPSSSGPIWNKPISRGAHLRKANFYLAHLDRMISRATQVFDAAGAKPLGQVTCDIAGTVVRQEPGPIGRLGVIQPADLQRQVEGGGEALAPLSGRIARVL